MRLTGEQRRTLQAMEAARQAGEGTVGYVIVESETMEHILNDRSTKELQAKYGFEAPPVAFGVLSVETALLMGLIQPDARSLQNGDKAKKESEV